MTSTLSSLSFHLPSITAKLCCWRRWTCLLALCLGSHALAQYPDQAVILMYHHVSERTPPSTSTTPAMFRTHLEYLRDNGFSVLPLEQVMDALRNGGSLPDKSAVISFDDGYVSVYTEALPILREFDWPFTVFVNSGLVGSNANLYASWGQLREMIEAGATIANHSISHPYMVNQEPGESLEPWRERMRREILDAEEVIARETGHNFKFFAYPYGEYNAEIQGMLEELGFIGFGQHSGAINATSDFTALPRFPFGGIYASMNSFPTKVNSLAYNLESLVPGDSVTTEASPSIELRLLPGDYRPERVNCFNNDEAIAVNRVEGEEWHLLVTTHVENRSRRFRYNCTAPGRDGRFYWLSLTWVNPNIPE